MSLHKAIENMANKKTALYNGTPITIINPVVHEAYDGSELFYGEVRVLNEDTNQEEYVQMEEIAENIKPKKLFGLF